MESLIQKLGNNEAILLMYLADELPAGDRAEVEQMLQTDAGMRAELERLRSALEAVNDGLSQLDAQSHSPAVTAMAQRNATKLMKQWQADQAVLQYRQTSTPTTRNLKFPWWAYPSAAAAAVLAAFLFWWGTQPGQPPARFAIPARPDMTVEQSEEANQFAEALDWTFDNPVFADSSQSLRTLQREVESPANDNDFWVDTTAITSQ
jgi:anti-sigma factor RsiW